jgi:hypothetical protein
MSIKWKDIGLQGKQLVRDLWLRKDIGIIKDSYSVTVFPNEVSLIRVYKKQ